MYWARNKEHLAFSLVELCVVIAIIAVLIGLLVPAVQSVRESANRSACQSNLRNIALACHAYHGQHRRLPPNHVAWGWNENQWSWLALLLPYVEQGGLYGAAGVSHGTFAQAGPCLASSVPVYRCPSDPTAGPSLNRANLEGKSIGLTNYKGVTGDCWCWGSYTNRCGQQCDGLSRANGAFSWQMSGEPARVVRLASITDGLSTTFLAGEDLPSVSAHCSWPYGNNAVGTCALPPNYSPPNFHPYHSWPDLFGFRSRHGGGLYFVMADGSVRWITDTMPPPVYRSLATIAGGEASHAD